MSRHGLASPDTLVDGEWRVVGGIRHWHPATTVDLKRRERGVVKSPVIDLLACPTCHARIGQTCRTKTGHTTTPHGSRLAPRLCICGALLRPQRRFCDPCRDRVNQENKNEWLRRMRARRPGRCPFPLAGRRNSPCGLPIALDGYCLRHLGELEEAS